MRTKGTGKRAASIAAAITGIAAALGGCGGGGDSSTSPMTFPPPDSGPPSRILYTTAEGAGGSPSYGELWSAAPDGGAAQRLGEKQSSYLPGILSPDRRRIAAVLLTQADVWTDEIWVMNADGSEPRRLTHNNVGESRLSWSPDGSRLLYFDGQWRTLRVADGSETALGLREARPLWLPDGRLLFVHDNQLCVSDADGSDRRAISRLYDFATADAIDRVPRFLSPDGTRVALIRNFLGWGGSDADWEIIELPTGRATRIDRPGRAAEGNVAWSPDGRRIVFRQMESRPGPDGAVMVTRLEVAGADGSPGRVLAIAALSPAFLSPYLGEAVWRPDGRQIVFAARLSASEPDGIFAADPDSGGAFPLSRAEGASGYYGPAFAPDGSALLSRAIGGGTERAFVVGAAGGAGRPLPTTSPSAQIVSVQWR